MTQTAGEQEGTFGRKVLWVDDDRVLLGLIKTTLEIAGFAVTATDVPSEAVRLAEEDDSFELLITDLSMPGITGAELAEQIAETGNRMPVLFVSGYSNRKLADYGVSGPGMHVLCKPFDPPQLIEKVREILGP